LVDMYAFRDIIDLMGGLDLTLEETLVDPTYRTCDNGVCSTLYYEAGVHHLNGTQALRVARSRHTTSDYSRAERQQLILEALQDKAKKLGLGDSVSLLKILKTILGSMDTDMSVQEAVGAYFKYQGFQIERGNVLSTANVLDNVPVPVNYVTSHVIQDCSTDPCHDQYAIDTLQPRGGNMNAVRWWVDGILNSD
jgi:anionic cell wall polymer biosynthesis LytR-Cps2A-Psr (LCP) family protein